MRSLARCYDELRRWCEGVPLVDCHDHTSACGPRYTDPIQVVVGGYYPHDLMSASSEKDVAAVRDASLPLEQRWELLERLWRRAGHTGYAQVTRRVLRKFFDEEDLTLEALRRMQDRLPDFSDEKAYEAVLEEAKIAVRLTHMLVEISPATLKLPPRARLVASLPPYHMVSSYADVQRLGEKLGRTITSLEEYVLSCREHLAAFKRAGAVALKDNSAYNRPLDFGAPTRAQAEEVFQFILADPRRRVGYPDAARPLGDYLFHELMRIARDLDLPVQIHTGHLAGVRGDVSGRNAMLLRPVLELHRDVRFDLFHGNWPFDGELLFLGKNYPNVALDLCWVNIIDPLYAQSLMRRALSSVPHGKVHAHGSDYNGSADRAWAHASITRDNVAVALADMVEMEYIDLDQARQVAADWMYNNPNEFFRLDLPPVGA